MQNPKFLYRPDDYQIFSMNEDGSYSTQEVHFTKDDDGIYRVIGLHKHGCHEYPLEQLLRLGFKEAKEKDFPKYKALQDLYWKRIAKEFNNDGHGNGDYDE